MGSLEQDKAASLERKEKVFETALPSPGRGLVLSLGLTGNRLAQFLLPMAMGVVAPGPTSDPYFFALVVGS